MEESNLKKLAKMQLIELLLQKDAQIKRLIPNAGIPKSSMKKNNSKTTKKCQTNESRI